MVNKSFFVSSYLDQFVCFLHNMVWFCYKLCYMRTFLTAHFSGHSALCKCALPLQTCRRWRCVIRFTTVHEETTLHQTHQWTNLLIQQQFSDLKLRRYCKRRFMFVIVSFRHGMLAEKLSQFSALPINLWWLNIHIITTMANPCDIAADLGKYIVKEVSFEICLFDFRMDKYWCFNEMFYI